MSAEKPWRGVFHYDPRSQSIVDGPAPLRPPDVQRLTKRGEGGIAFQMPPGYLKETGKYNYVKSGPFKGRLQFRSRQEAIDIGKRHEDASGMKTTYDH